MRTRENRFQDFVKGNQKEKLENPIGLLIRKKKLISCNSSGDKLDFLLPENRNP